MPEQTGPGRTGAGNGTGSGDAGPGASAPRGPGAPGTAPDFFDRLLARHAPSVAPGTDAVVRVRPRLPGPFERIEAVGAADEPETEEVAAPWPATRDTGPRPGDVQRALRETRTEREHTVLHTERAPEREDPVVHGPERPGNEPSLLRPTISPLPRQPRAAEAGGRRPGQGGEPAAEPPGSAGTPLLPGAVVASPSASGVPRPASPADAATAAVREAARAAARRGPRGAERVVHVQIGRLEVSAAGPAPGAGRQERAPARRAPAVGLEDYLRRGRDGDGRR